jgi:peptide methionine sulfoxide reductase msrA/msrB
MKQIYLAAGCFWATEKLFAGVKGVTNAVSGYANGKEEIKKPSYELVCGGMTQYKETVKIDFDETKVSLRKLLLIYFNVIDPTIYDRQGMDRGTQYQTGIYYTEDDQLPVIEEISALVKEKVRAYCVETEPLRIFYPAEEYHQKYLDKNPGGYCHIPRATISKLPELSEDELMDLLNAKEYY